jgi:ADP-heptose:LPS heptosyltransferase
MTDRMKIKKIAIVRLGKIGDLIVTNFAIRKIRTSFPNADILLVTLPINRELLKYSTDVNQIRFFHRGIDLVRLILLLRKNRSDLLLDFNDSPSSTSKLLAQYGRARVRVGFAFETNRRYLTIPVECPSKERSHITERLRKIPESIGLSFEDYEIRPSLAIGETELDQVKLHLTRENPSRFPLVVINLSAGDRSRYWQVEKWSKLLSGIRGVERDVKLLVLFSLPDENMARKLVALHPEESLIWPAHSGFQHFAAYISQASLLISPDTSAIHVACACRVPVLGLYPAVEWNYQSWRPIGTAHQIVRPREGVVQDIRYEDVIEAYFKLRGVLSEGRQGQ